MWAIQYLDVLLLRDNEIKRSFVTTKLLDPHAYVLGVKVSVNVTSTVKKGDY